jgi:citrate lyase subunit beta/citryl-CoA lyase
MIRKAEGLPADEVFLDLEDAVASGAKNDEARSHIVEALLHGDWTGKVRAVRVNSVDTAWCYQDLVHVVGQAGSHLDAVVVPKIEHESHIHFVAHLLQQLEASQRLDHRIAIEAQIETARGMVRIEQIAAASDRIEALIFGPGDYAASMGVPQLTVGVIEPDYPGDPWHYALARIATTARAFGQQAIDGPYAAFRDLDGFRESARRSRLMGFDGKWAIHPGQIDVCNQTYAPTDAESARAQRIVDAYRQATETQHLGAVTFEGEMIDEASRKLAESVLARGRAARASRG